MRIAITQRVDTYPERPETRDALDQAWAATLPRLLQREVQLLPLANAPAMAQATLASWKPEMLVLSGGNDIGSCPARDATEAIALAYAEQHAIPVLAICRGMQFLQHQLAGALVELEGHVATEHVIQATNVESPATLSVNSYHRFGIKQIAAGLKPLYTHADGSIEAAEHTSKPWLGIMWHPERSSNAEADEWIMQQLSRWL